MNMTNRVKCEICDKGLHGQGFLDRRYKTVHNNELDPKIKNN